MNKKYVLPQRWREMNISAKFAVAFGLLLFLVLLVSGASYLALGIIHREINEAILASTEIQRLVLEMDARLEQARRQERDFFLNYQSEGFEQARQKYALPTSAQIGEVVALSAQLQELIATSDTSQALQESNVNLTFYLSASGRYMKAFNEAVELLAQLAGSDSGLQAQLEQKSTSLQSALQALDEVELRLLYYEMQSWEKEYLLLRKRYLMQSAFNVGFELSQAIKATPATEQRSQALVALQDYNSVAQEILDLDVAIRSKFQEFELQAQVIDPISEELVRLADEQVQRSREQIDQTSRLATLALLAAALAGMILTGLTAIVLNNSITRNVIWLTATAVELQNGNMDARTQVQSGDEIGLLAATFNQMAAQLQTLYTSLEQQVISRTERLQQQTIELKQAKNKAERAQHAAEKNAQAALAASRAKSAFLANMSHELRTPLNAILGFTQLMRRDPAFSTAHRDNLRIMHRSGEHLLDLINDVLEMSKIEAGRVSLDQNDFDLYRLLDTLESMFSARAQGKGLQISFQRAPDVPQYVRTDERKLRQTLINLLDNAVKFTEQGGVMLRVTVDRDRDREASNSLSPISIYFEVQDTGVGIAPEEMDKIFEAFTQTASGQKAQEGTGLGLALSRRFVQLMGGDITVQSPLPTGGSGSLFRFDVQVSQADVGAVQEQQPERRVVGLAPGQRAYRILVAEDVEASRALLVQLLTAVGFEVRQAANGQEALEIWQTWQPHLIWMDMRMPIMDGYEATKRIKSPISNLQSPLIIALTAHAFEEERAAILAAGCDGFVRKPFREQEIFEVMARHLGTRYVYEALPPATEPPDELIPVTLKPDDLAALPPGWIADMRQSAMAGEAGQIFALLEQITAAHAPLAQALAQLVREFRFDKLVTLTQSDKPINLAGG